MFTADFGVDKLLYLDWDDEVKLLQNIVGSTDHLVNDAEALASLLADSLTPSKSFGKKDAKFVDFPSTVFSR